MADKEAKVKFTADTQEFNSNIKKLNGEMSGLRAEMKLNAQQMKGTGDQVDLLSKRHQLLEKEMEVAKAKTEELSKKQEAAAQIFGENSEEAQKLATQVTNARTEEQKIQNELDRTTDALEEQVTAAESAGGAYQVLTDTINEQENELDSMKQAYMDAILEYGEGSEEAEALATQIRNLSRELENNKAKMEGAKKSADDMAGSMKNAGKESDAAEGLFAGAWEKMDNVMMTLDLSSVIGKCVDMLQDLGRYAADAAQQYDESMAVMAQGTGATGEALAQMTKEANDAYEALSNVNMTAQGTAGVYGALKTRFDVTGDKAVEMTKDVADFAKVSGQDGVNAVDMLADITRQWGGEMDDCNGLMDELIYSAQESGASVDDLGGALAGNAFQWKMLGYSQEDALELMSQVVWAGGDVSDVTGGMQTAIKKLTGEVDDIPGTFQQALDVLKEWDGESDILQQKVGDTGLTIEDVFGTKIGQTMAGAMSAVANNAGELNYNLDEASGRMKETAENSVTLSDEWNRLGKTLKDNIGETIGPALTDFVGWMADVVQAEDSMAKADTEKTATMSQNARSLSTTTQTETSQIGAAWEGLKTKAGTTWANISETVGQKSQSAVELAGQKWESLKTSTGSAWDDIRGEASRKWAEIKETIGEEIEKIKKLPDKLKGWSLPAIKLPHFSVTGGVSPYGLGGQGSLPHVSVTWRAKGAVFNGATIIPTMYGLQGVGEAGPEAVAPIDVLQGYVNEAVQGSVTIDYDLMGQKVAEACARMNITIDLGERQFGRAVRRALT